MYEDGSIDWTDRRNWYPVPGKYLAACRKAFEVTAAGGKVQLFWNTRELDAEGWRREFREALDRRINLKGGIEPKGRKATWEYQVALRRDVTRIRDILQRRVYFPQNRWETPEMQRRYGHLLEEYWAELRELWAW